MSVEDIAAEYYNIGNGYYELGNYQRAIRYYELALTRRPDLLPATWNLALALIHLHDYQTAEILLQEWLESDPENIEAREALAVVFRGQARTEESLQMFQKVLEIAPENTTALNNIGIILWELDRGDEAAECFLRVLEYQPYEMNALYDLAVLYDELERTEPSLEYAETYVALAEEGRDVSVERILTAYSLLARGYTVQERYYRALEMYAVILDHEAAEAGEYHRSAWFEQARILLTSVEDPDAGRESLRNALEQGFNDRSRIAQLLQDERMLDRPEVEAMLQEHNLLPIPTESESGPEGGGLEPATEFMDTEYLDGRYQFLDLEE